MASAVLATSPRAADSQETAVIQASSSPIAASQPPGVPVGRKPMTKAAPRTRVVDRALRVTVAATCPARNGVPPTSSVRNRSTTPRRMSSLTVTAVLAAPNPAQRTSTPGTT